MQGSTRTQSFQQIGGRAELAFKAIVGKRKRVDNNKENEDRPAPRLHKNELGQSVKEREARRINTFGQEPNFFN